MFYTVKIKTFVKWWLVSPHALYRKQIPPMGMSVGFQSMNLVSK